METVRWYKSCSRVRKVSCECRARKRFSQRKVTFWRTVEMENVENIWRFQKQQYDSLLAGTKGVYNIKAAKLSQKSRPPTALPCHVTQGPQERMRGLRWKWATTLPQTRTSCNLPYSSDHSFAKELSILLFRMKLLTGVGNDVKTRSVNRDWRPTSLAIAELSFKSWNIWTK